MNQYNDELLQILKIYLLIHGIITLILDALSINEMY